MYWDVVILLGLVLPFALTLTTEFLHWRQPKHALPEEVADVYDEAEYEKSQDYQKAQTKLSLFAEIGKMVFWASMIWYGGFAFADATIKNYFGHFPSEFEGLILIFTCVFVSYVIGLPFQIYGTFVIEEKYGFNRTTLKLFVVDQLKASVLMLLIGGPILYGVLYIFQYSSEYPLAWLFVWLLIIVVQLLMMMLSPVLMSFFYKFEPLSEGELKSLIESYAKKQHFSLSGVFQMDGSKRSSKANAFFAGIGKFRKIVLFDTLIENLTNTELLMVLAHEMGHFKCKHILKQMIYGICTTGMMLYVVQTFMLEPGLFNVLQCEASIHLGLIVLLMFVLTPLSLITGVFSNILSRKYEYEADAYAAKTCESPDGLISGLKKLTRQNLSCLTPHPLKAFIEYSHPTIVERIRALNCLSKSSS